MAKRGAGLAKPMQPDEVLAKIVGDKPLSRPEVVKKLWEYIKANNLQDANKKRLINTDAALAEVMDGKKQVDMFEMQKLLGKHLKAV